MRFYELIQSLKRIQNFQIQNGQRYALCMIIKGYAEIEEDALLIACFSIISNMTSCLPYKRMLSVISTNSLGQAAISKFRLVPFS